MSEEKFPTLCSVLLAFSVIQRRWEKLQEKLPQYSLIIQSGIDKLDNYIEKINAVPAYIVAMSKFDFFWDFVYISIYFSVLDPNHKLEWFSESDDSNDAEWAKSIFIHEVS